jgi:hypothetical protein
VFSTSKKSRQNGNRVTFGEVSSVASGSSSVHLLSLKSTHHDGDRHVHESDDEEEEEDDDDDLPIITKQRRKTETRAKRISSHVISLQELADLGITSDNHPHRNEKSIFGYNGKLYEPDGWTPSSSRHQCKVKSAHSSKTQLIDRDQDKHSAATLSQTSPRRRRPCTPTRSAKHGRRTLVLNSDPFTPSPPGSPAPPREPEPENDDEDDSDYQSDAQPPKKKAKQSKKSTPKSTPKKSTPKTSTPKSEPIKGTKKTKKFTTTPESTSKRSAAAKNRTYNFPVAHTLSEASEADKMMFRWKSERRPWKEITEEWGKIVGRTPGASSLSVRYIKLKEKFGKMGDPDVSFLFLFCFADLFLPCWLVGCLLLRLRVLRCEQLHPVCLIASRNFLVLLACFVCFELLHLYSCLSS